MTRRTARNRERSYKSLTDVLEFAIEQKLKEVYTVLPGIVEEFDAETRRAKVRGATKIALPDGSYLSRPPIVNVPTVFQCGGGYTVYFPVQPGEVVLLLYSMRGLTEFKKTFEEANPTMSSLMSERDVVMLPGFGSLTITPVDEDALTIQDEDGDNYIMIKGEDIKIKTENNVTIEAGNRIQLRAPAIDFDGTVTGDNV